MEISFINCHMCSPLAVNCLQARNFELTFIFINFVYLLKVSKDWCTNLFTMTKLERMGWHWFVGWGGGGCVLLMQYGCTVHLFVLASNEHGWIIISHINQLIVFDVLGWIQGSLASSQCIREGCGFCYQKNYLKKWLLQEKWVYKKERAKKKIQIVTRIHYIWEH